MAILILRNNVLYQCSMSKMISEHVSPSLLMKNVV